MVLEIHLDPMQNTRKQESENSRQPVNRLPCEVLSQIFVLCRNKERKRGYPETFQQTVLPAVCRYWRKVALDTKELWSLVTLFDSPPFEYSKLLLERSGPTAPLDLEIRLSERFWCQSNDPTQAFCTREMLNVLNFIVENGGATCRWRSFWFYTPVDAPIKLQYVALGFLQKHPLLALERFQIKHDGMISRHDPGGRLDKLLFAKRCPRLKAITVEQVPLTYLPSSASLPRLVGLTRLEIVFPAHVPHPRQIQETLTELPALTTLSMDTRKVRFPCREFNTDIRNRTMTCITGAHLPNLRALGLMFTASGSLALWEYSLLWTLKAPNVQNLRFHLENGASETPTRYFVKNLSQRANSTHPAPLSSRLTGLDVFVPRESDPTRADPQEELLAAYPGLTTLVLRRGWSSPGVILQPRLVPRLHRLFIHAQSPSELKEAIAPRYAAGVGPKIVEVPFLTEDTESVAAEYREALDGLDVKVCLSHLDRWNYRAREALGFEDD